MEIAEWSGKSGITNNYDLEDIRASNSINTSFTKAKQNGNNNTILKTTEIIPLIAKRTIPTPIPNEMNNKVDDETLSNTNAASLITIKFHINNKHDEIFTMAFPNNIKICDVIKELSKILHTNNNDKNDNNNDNDDDVANEIISLQINDGETLKDTSAEISQLPKSRDTIELKINSKRDDIKLNKEMIYGHITTVDIITVFVNQKSLTIEIENESLNKTKDWLGGYKGKYENYFYHNATTQTECYQHYKYYNKKTVATNTLMNKAIQTTNNNNNENQNNNQLLDTDECTSKLLKHIIVIQRAVRKWLKRKNNNITKNNKTNITAIYKMINDWYNGEKQVIQNGRECEYKEKYLKLLHKQLKLLSFVERKKVQLKRQKQIECDKKLIDKLSECKTFKNNNQVIWSIDTLENQLIRKLKELNNRYSNCDIKELIKVNIELQLYFKDVDCKFSKEIIKLLKRENDMITNGINKRHLLILRNRIKNHIMCFVKEKQQIDMVTVMTWCAHCNRLLPNNHFELNAKLLNMCNACKLTENIACKRKDLTDYRIMLKQIQKHECTFPGGHTSICHKMQAQDIYDLVEVIWNRKCVITGQDDINQLHMIRWNKKEQWAPCNCILIGKSQMKKHLSIEHLQEYYEPIIVATVTNKHLLAKIHFMKLLRT